MLHLPPLISDLGIILATAGMVTLLFKRIGQPVVLGYLLAGVLVGPEISFLPTIQERDAIQIWAEIGVIVLLFGLGLEFSFKKLAAVGRGATVTATTEILAMFGMGYLVGRAFGWSEMDSIFLGGILSISSTTIIVRALDELNMKRRHFADLVFGALIVEDLAAILLLVILTSISISQTFEGTQLLWSATRLGFFLTLWFLGGILLVPWFLRKIRPMLNEETMLIASLGLCLTMVLLATHSGFSPALGAFVMGSILAETPDGERIEHVLRPVRDLFAAIFFVSVGMLLDLQILADNAWPIFVLAVVTIVGKTLSTGLGALISGYRLRHALQAGMSMAQIGEFSFIIATLGLSLKVTSDFLYPLAVAVSVITTFTTPYMIRSSDSLYDWIAKRLPPQVLARLDQDVDRQVPRNSTASPLDGIGRILLHAVIVIGIGLSMSRVGLPWLLQTWGDEPITRYASMALTVLMALPFLWAIILSRASLQKSLLVLRTRAQDFNLVRFREVFALLGRALIATILLGFIISEFISAVTSLVVIALIAMSVGFLGVRNFTWIYDWLERRFIGHLNERERERELEALRAKAQLPALAPWDAHLTEFEIHPDSPVVGHSLAELKFREDLGVTVAMIRRGQRQILAPRRDALLMTHDRIYVIGTDEQLANLTLKLQPQPSEAAGPQGVVSERAKDYGLFDLILHEGSSVVGRSIRESGLREKTDGLIVGVERDLERILNPDSSMVLRAGDRLWVVGRKPPEMQGGGELAPLVP
ncbi:MAG TPA: cation:proton antiporter [Pseudobdellovibrionaceae bacterium]|nr:cation:proton antiporter [Pseudobdellovibrionaceae bacterium]